MRALWILIAVGCGGDHVIRADASPIADSSPDATACTLTRCGDACVDVMTDVANCGSCGHACGCGATTCTAGACDSAVLAPVQGGPDTLALADGILYWGADSDRTVATVAVTGGAVTTLYPGRTAVRGFAFDASRVYFSRFNFNIMESAALDGASSGNYTNAQESGADGVVSDANAVYWTTYNTGNIRKAAHGAPVQAGTTLLAGQMRPDGLAADANYLYWTTNYVGGGVMKMAKTGGVAVPLATMRVSPHGIAVDASYVYWTEQGTGLPNSGGVERVPLDPANGTAITTFAANQPGPSAIAVDANYVYWTDPTAGTVMKAPLAGGPPIQIASGEATPVGLVVTASCAYFADFADGQPGTGSIRSHDLD